MQIMFITPQDYDIPPSYTIFEYESVESAKKLFDEICQLNHDARQTSRDYMHQNQGAYYKMQLISFMDIYPDSNNANQYTIMSLDEWIVNQTQPFISEPWDC